MLFEDRDGIDEGEVYTEPDVVLDRRARTIEVEGVTECSGAKDGGFFMPFRESANADRRDL